MMAGKQAEPGHEKHVKEKQAHEEHMAHQHHGATATEPQTTCCLLHDKNYEAKLINLKNGIRLELKRKS